MSNLTDALIAATLVGGSGGSGGGSGLPEASGQADNTALSVQSGEWAASGKVLPEITPENQTVVFAEQSVSFSGPAGGPYVGILQGVSIASGVTYTVTWDGTTYTCVGSEISMGGQTRIVAGNLSIGGPGEDTGEPFVLVHVSRMNGTNVMTTTTGPHTIGVTTGTPQTPPDGYVLGVDGGEWKAVPSGGGESGGGSGGVFVVQLSSEPTTTETALPTGITYAKIVEAIESGKIPMLRYGDAATGRLIPFSAYSPNGKWVYFRTFSNQISGGTITGVMLESYRINSQNKIKKESGVLSFDNGGGK